MKRLLIPAILFLAPAFAAAQQLMVYPGDINNNGVVNNVDFLYLGMAYNYAGAPRDSAGRAFEPFPVDPWPLQFASGLNMAYADCNGDGFVNYYFDAFPLYTYYGMQRDSMVTPDVFSTGLPGIAPPLRFDHAAVPTTVQGSQILQLPIELGAQNLPAEDFYGIAFSVKTDPSAVNMNLAKFDFSETSWINPDNDRIWMSKKVAADRVDVGLVRTDRNQRRGFGRIGYAEFIIIVDVLPFQQDIPLILEQIKLIDKYGNSTSVAGDTVWLHVPPEALSSDNEPGAGPALRIAPNPANDRLEMRCEAEMESLTLTDLSGRIVFQAQLPGQMQYTLSLPELSSGLYLLRVETEKGVALRKVGITQQR